MDANKINLGKPVFIKLGTLGWGHGQGLRSIATHSGVGVSKTLNVDDNTAVRTRKDKF